MQGATSREEGCQQDLTDKPRWRKRIEVTPSPRAHGCWMTATAYGSARCATSAVASGHWTWLEMAPRQLEMVVRCATSAVASGCWTWLEMALRQPGMVLRLRQEQVAAQGLAS
ncbi:hypothetical protein CYMTET_4808 [Cymbomonas tetramitiformis]|uniref:Uncharacterized protein n=1 Tax=Cymbomonas tetramitiformis TaxID=36881 RepID=A0AAE0H2C4_9CHLO|nr:hypothetical protein CYMTET_4808 [Cymbomonas tetramitiformis]